MPALGSRFLLSTASVLPSLRPLIPRNRRLIRGGSPLAPPVRASASAMRDYYDTRAPEYDEWYLGAGRFAGLACPDWDEDLDAAEADRGQPRTRADTRCRLRHGLPHATPAWG